jgi:medium-chain acyl-[acyl-carrier-protein] hydrolase
MNNSWLQRLSARPGTARLFCFPYAGGSASAYRLWPGGLPEGLEVLGIQLPARANRLREAPVASVPGLVDSLVEAVRPLLDQPYAFFGHSMGSLLSVEVARALAARGEPLPAHLVVSGRRPSHVPDIVPPLRHLSDAEFVAQIDKRYGGIPVEILQNRDVLELLLPALRADIAALETFHPSGTEPLECPITAYGGSDDRVTPREHLDAWRSVTGSSFRVRVFTGGHFYLDQQRAAVLADLADTLAPMLRNAPGLQPSPASPPESRL